jgi:hypothetical protein
MPLPVRSPEDTPFLIINDDGSIMTAAEIAEKAADAIFLTLPAFIKAEVGRVDWSDPVAIRRGVDACDPITEAFGKDRGKWISGDATNLLRSPRVRRVVSV